MKKILICVVSLFFSTSLYSSLRRAPYFTHYQFNECYVFLGNVIGVDTIFNYTQFDQIIGYVCSYQINVIEKFDLDIPDTVWIRPSVNSNDSIFFPIENYVSCNQPDVPRGLYYFRVCRKLGAFYYSTIDYYMGIPLVDDFVYGRLTNLNDYWNEVRYFFGKTDKYQKWSRSRFERVLKRRLKIESRNNKLL